jgi:hypothetical protein
MLATIIGTVITLVLTGIGYYLVPSTPANGPDNLILAFIGTTIGLIMSLLFQINGNYKKLLSKSEDHYNKFMSNVNDNRDELLSSATDNYNKMLSTINNNHNNLLTDLPIIHETMYEHDLCKDLTTIAKHWKQIRAKNPHALILEIRDAAMTDFIKTLDQHARGQATFRGYETDYLDSAVATVDKQIFAISMLSLAWWQTTKGQKYKDQNLTAIKDGKKISRIFVLNKGTPDPEKKKMTSMIHDFAKAGMTAYILDLDKGEPHEKPVPLIICDDNLVIVSEYDEKHMPTKHIAYSGEHVKECMRTFNLLCGSEQCRQV